MYGSRRKKPSICPWVASRAVELSLREESTSADVSIQFTAGRRWTSCTRMHDACPPWMQPRGKFQVNLPQMPPLGGRIRIEVDSRNHLFAPGLSPGWTKEDRGYTELPGELSQFPGDRAPSWESYNPSIDLDFRPQNSGEVSRGEQMLYYGTDPESYITEYTSVCGDKTQQCSHSL